MARINLTKQGLVALKVNQRTEFWDQTFPGFGVRVSPEGHKAYVLMYRHGGRLRRLTLGSFPEVSLAEARRRARACMGQAAEGEDPVAKGTAHGGLTFGDLSEEYLELYARQKKSTWKEDARMLRRDVLPAWEQRYVEDITKRDVVRILDGIVARGAGVQANRTHSLLSRMFTWALRRDMVEHNPCAGVERPTEEKPRERVLSAGEIHAAWQATRHESPSIAHALRLLLLTAQRSIEVKRMAWGQIEGNRWEIPGEITKNRRTHIVPLSREAMAVVEACRVESSPLVLPARGGGSNPLSRGVLNRATRGMAKRLGFHFTPHDLRRTAATLMASLGVDRFIIAQLLNHTDRSMTGIYDRHRYWKEKLAAMQVLGDHLASIVGPIDAASLACVDSGH